MYSEIYDQVFVEQPGYQSATGSPGYRMCIENRSRLKSLGPKYLDYGCGPGFAVELMGSYFFRKESNGVDVSRRMVDFANKRIGMNLVHQIENGRTPFSDASFDLVTCFDMLEHLDREDIILARDEIMRVLRPGGTFFCSISLRLSETFDKDGRDLHRTIENPDWWDSIFNFDEFTVTKEFMEMSGWKIA